MRRGSEEKENRTEYDKKSVLNIALVAAVSADTNSDNSDRERNIETLNKIKSNLKDFLGKDKSAIDYYKKKCDESIAILETEIKANGDE